MNVLRFVSAAACAMVRGGKLFRLWLAVLALLIAVGAVAYSRQLATGLVVTGMSDQVSWGFYIANFAFLVGIAAAAVLLVLPSYVFHRLDTKAVVILGDALAVAAVVGALSFVIVDLGRPDRVWHMLPFIGRFNFPKSMLAWDVVVLSGYLVLNLLLPAYVLYSRYRDRPAASPVYFPTVLLAIVWAISIHTVTAFLFAANSARPYWNIALLAPRFIATAFVSGPALIILVLQLSRRFARAHVEQSVIEMLALIMAVSLQICLFFVLTELFTDFYNEGAHAASVRYLYVGLKGLHALRPWIWTALAFNVVAAVILSVHPLRRRTATLNLACGLAFVGVWIEKGMGLVVPGFIPTTLGEVFEYTPTLTELGVAIGIWALVALVFTLLANASLAIERGEVRLAAAAGPPAR